MLPSGPDHSQHHTNIITTHLMHTQYKTDTLSSPYLTLQPLSPFLEPLRRSVSALSSPLPFSYSLHDTGESGFHFLLSVLTKTSTLTIEGNNFCLQLLWVNISFQWGRPLSFFQHFSLLVSITPFPSFHSYSLITLFLAPLLAHLFLSNQEVPNWILLSSIWILELLTDQPRALFSYFLHLGMSYPFLWV